MLRFERGHLERRGIKIALAVEGTQGGIDLALQKRHQTFGGVFISRLGPVELIVGLLHVGVVAMVDQIFFGRDVVVQAGFGEAKSAGHIGQSSGACPLGVEQFRRTGQYGRALGLALQARLKGERFVGVEVSKISFGNAGPGRAILKIR